MADYMQLGATKTAPVFVPAKYLNRHGMITGGTGTGKSVSVVGMAEALARIGVPSFITDIKGDLSGMAKPSTATTDKGRNMAPWGAQACRIELWDVYGKQGRPISASLSDIGAPLAAQALGLSDAQAGVLEIVFAVARDQGRPLDTLADLRGLIAYCVEHRREMIARYGLVTQQSAAGIGRSMLQLEQGGGASFFAPNTTDLDQLIGGGGVAHLLDCVELMREPRLYGAVLLWLLDKLGRELPEVGDQDRPVLALFLDEAHLIFSDCPAPVVRAVESTVRLIRSKGVAVFFATQSPADVPDGVARQLHLRVQHALRATTPKDRAMLKNAAESMPPGKGFKVLDVIEGLPPGTALVSYLNDKGLPTATEIVNMALPRCRLSPLTDQERREILGPEVTDRRPAPPPPRPLDVTERPDDAPAGRYPMGARLIGYTIAAGPAFYGFKAMATGWPFLGAGLIITGAVWAAAFYCEP